MKSKKETRIFQVKGLISLIPEGRKSGYQKLVLYELADKHGIVMTETGLQTFIQSGYSTVADTIIEAITAVVNKMIQEEKQHQSKVQKILQAA